MFLRLGESGRRRGSVYGVTDYVDFSQLGKRCQLGLLGLGFAPGLAGLGFSWKKNVYYSNYSIFTSDTPFFKYMGR
jgi:restriction endonuclease S subunit